MKKLIIANWKAYLSLDKAIALSRSLSANNNVIIAPSVIHLAFLAQKFPHLNFAAQDISSITNNYGAYTGETPAIMLQDIGVKYAIIGHSERRSNMLDNAHSISLKLQYCLKLGITPIVCIGETLEDRKKKIHLDVIAKQLHAIFDNIGNLDGDIVIAYEPFWSVGTGVVPSFTEIKEVISTARATVNFVDNRLFLVYGGGVKRENAYDLINLDGVDGLLMGKASIDMDLFGAILSSCTMR